MKNVIIAAISITRPGQKVSGLKEGDFALILADPTKYQDKLTEITCKVEFHQEREVASPKASASGRRGSALAITEVMEGHSKIGGTRTKKAWHNSINVAYLIKKGYKVGADLSEVEGKGAYLLTEEFSTANFRDTRIVDSPKRKGKGGAFLLDANGCFIFQDTALVFAEGEFAGFTYSQFVKVEQDAAIEFVSELDATGVPLDFKDDKGFFNVEFEKWLTKEYASRNQKVLQVVE